MTDGNHGNKKLPRWSQWTHTQINIKRRVNSYLSYKCQCHIHIPSQPSSKDKNGKEKHENGLTEGGLWPWGCRLFCVNASAIAHISLMLFQVRCQNSISSWNTQHFQGTHKKAPFGVDFWVPFYLIQFSFNTPFISKCDKFLSLCFVHIHHWLCGSK